MNIKNATVEDIAAVAAVEAECFPPAEAATEKEFVERIKYYGKHFWLMYEGEVSKKNIEFLCYGLGSVGIDELLERIFSKKSPFLVFEKMLESGLDEMGLMRDMEEYFNKLFLFFAYARANGKIEPKEILGYAPPNLISDEYKRRCLQVRSEEGYLEIFKLLGKWRNELMQGKKSISLQSLIKIQGFIR